VEITADDVIVTQAPLEGWGVATSAGDTVALDLSISPALRSAGWSREVIRFIQDTRKSEGLDVTDRIMVRWAADDPDLAAALAEHGPLIASDVLATQFEPVTDADEPAPGAGSAPLPWHEHEDPGSGLRVWLAVAGRG
jgi:isoleucyl-tRNA synthetase